MWVLQHTGIVALGIFTHEEEFIVDMGEMTMIIGMWLQSLELLSLKQKDRP